MKCVAGEMPSQRKTCCWRDANSTGKVLPARCQFNRKGVAGEMPSQRKRCCRRDAKSTGKVLPAVKSGQVKPDRVKPGRVVLVGLGHIINLFQKRGRIRSLWSGLVGSGQVCHSGRVTQVGSLIGSGQDGSGQVGTGHLGQVGSGQVTRVGSSRVGSSRIGLSRAGSGQSSQGT